MKYLRTSALRSGSSGNSILISTDQSSVLVDAGITGKGLTCALGELDESPDKLKGILITHEHCDHISGLGVILRRYKIPFFINKETLKQVLPGLGRFDPDLIRIIYPDESFRIDDLEIMAFPISHDAVAPVGYTISSGLGTIGVCTDLGCTDERVFQALSGSKLCYLEANYDQELLRMGNYPLKLKERIAGHHGHLSNDESGAACIRLLQQGTERIILSHLSQENNFPHLALLTVNDALTEAGAKEGLDYQLTAARRYDVSEPQEI
ncbi:MAG TPA: MBL fold metallo-hydrolase [Clostridiaceae bacterium]|nr:MBL fold metallo-hydrolase [Clostridiaceae bacterium]